MKNIIVIMLITVLLSACSGNKAEIRSLNQRIATQEEKVMILEEQMVSMGYNNIYQLNDHIQALNNRINNLERGAQSTMDGTVHHDVVTPGVVINEEINNIYSEGRRLYELKDYPSAIRSFTTVTQQAPNHDLAANSYYWIGECYWAMGDFSAARLAFQRVQDQYPDSGKFIDAQAKIAMTWIRQNRKELARTILLAIKRDFPRYENMQLIDQQLRLTQ